MDDTTDYARRVVDGEIVAGPLVRAACKRHLDDLKHGHERGLVWRLDKAAHAIEFFSRWLRLNGSKFEGKPFDPQPWQRFIIGSIFGWYGSDGLRRFRSAYIEIGKGNGKSPIAAGIGLYMLMSDGEERAEVYAAATKKDQAIILFRDGVAMVDQSPALAKRLLKTGGAQCWNLAYPATNSFFRAISSDDGQSGPRPHCALIDELHEHKDSTVVEMMEAGARKRQSSLVLEITNSGVDRTTICYQHHELSDRVVNGVEVMDEWFAYVCGLDDDDDPLEDESCWLKANPNLGVSIFEKELRLAVRKAKGMPAAASKIRRLHFCQWVDAENPWIAGDLWLACEIKDESGEIDRQFVAEERWKDRECVGAIDLSGSTDLTSLALAFERDDGGIDAVVEFWTPKQTLIDRARRDRVPYDVWAKDGHVTTTPGRSVKYAFIAHRIAELQGVYGFHRLAFDAYRIKDLESELDELGIEIELIPHPQGYFRSQSSSLWMPRSIELAEDAIGEGTLHVAFNPCLRWNVASAVMEKDAKDNRIFTKRKAKGRIDGAVALTMAIGLLSEKPADAASPFEFSII